MRRGLLSFGLGAALVVGVGRSGYAGERTTIAPPATVAAPALGWLTGRWARPAEAGYLEITWTAIGGGWRGVLVNVQREQPRRIVATYDLQRSKSGWTLRLAEGKSRLLFPPASMPGDQHLRFERHAGAAGPQAVDIRIVDGKLFIGRLGKTPRGAGTAAGAVASSGLWLERAPEP